MNSGFHETALVVKHQDKIGQLQNLQSILDFSYNNLTGKIPPSIGTLSKLETLDLSHNQLTGELPQVSEMRSLGRLNFSYNNLQGKLDRLYAHWPADAFAGNMNLCGSPLQKCKDLMSSLQESGLSESSVVLISAISTTLAIVLLLLGAALFFKHKRAALRRASEVDSAYSSSSSQAQRRPLFDNAAAKRDFRWVDIMEATNNLSDEFIIGSGGSGTIYKAELFTGETVAIKRIPRKDDLLLDRSFAREIRTLGRIRHRHLARLLGYCSNRGAGSNLLIYEYMENGSLWDWLHKQTMNDKKKKSIDWEARLKIAVGLAQGLEYLHHDCVPKIIHRDVKSSNLLLDANMEAHLGDFGLAKSLTDDYDSLDTGSNLWFAGSYGYIAPEYAYSLKATEKSDVYSMGIVLMELVSGRMPTGGTFGVDMDMVRWVESRMEMQGSEHEELIDPLLKPLLPNEETAAFQVLEIALQCTKTAPAERPSSRHTCDLLVHVCNDRMAMVPSEKMSPDHLYAFSQ
ncbi:LRR receptor-like serine/threonine-protein kinase GSO1 [Forsythia ovata]|uniref:non-specific serine/threonine protein kinase n=1 Tax=Forsythia ovata TaxID=205694 RepID=A0ABD1QGU6_9LAMI